MTRIKLLNVSAGGCHPQEVYWNKGIQVHYYHRPKRYTSHAPFRWHPLGPNRSIQIFVQVYVLHTEYKLLRICAWSGSLSHSVNITTLYSHALQVYVFQSFNNSVISVMALRYPVWCVGFVFLCSTCSRLPEDGIPVPKNLGVRYLSWIVFYDLNFSKGIFWLLFWRCVISMWDSSHAKSNTNSNVRERTLVYCISFKCFIMYLHNAIERYLEASSRSDDQKVVSCYDNGCSWPFMSLVLTLLNLVHALAVPFRSIFPSPGTQTIPLSQTFQFKLCEYLSPFACEPPISPSWVFLP
jgi:hypothetical protein